MGVIVLSDSDDEFLERMRTSLESDPDYRIVVAATPVLVSEAVSREHARVVVFGPSVAIADALEAGAALASSRPPVSVVLIAQHVTTELLRQALRAGMRDVLSAGDHTYDDVAKSVRDAYAAASAREDDGSSTAPAVQLPRGRIITVFSTKGGVGKSVLATNLAVAAAADQSRRVVLVDLDLASGDDGIMLNLPPTHTILDAAQAIERLDTDMLKGLFVQHESGANVLLAPVRPEDAEMVTAAKVGRVLDLVRQVADVVIVDTPGALDEVVLTAIDRSDVVLAVATMDMPSVKNMRISLQKLSQLGYSEGLVHLVLNRADSKVLIDVNDIEEALSRRVTARIPSDRLVPRSVNKGVPIVTDAPKSGVARSIVELAAVVADSGEAR
jgi:pilus assembly protein CpaE